MFKVEQECSANWLVNNFSVLNFTLKISVKVYPKPSIHIRPIDVRSWNNQLCSTGNSLSLNFLWGGRNKIWTMLGSSQALSLWKQALYCNQSVPTSWTVLCLNKTISKLTFNRGCEIIFFPGTLIWSKVQLAEIFWLSWPSLVQPNASSNVTATCVYISRSLTGSLLWP